MKDDVAVDLATSARAMREACARGDARALRRAFQSHCAHFYDAHGRTMRADEKTAALRDVDDDGYALIDRAALADDLGAYEWLAERARAARSPSRDDGRRRRRVARAATGRRGGCVSGKTHARERGGDVRCVRESRGRGLGDVRGGGARVVVDWRVGRRDAPRERVGGGGAARRGETTCRCRGWTRRRGSARARR